MLKRELRCTKDSSVQGALGLHFFFFFFFFFLATGLPVFELATKVYKG